MLRSVTRVSDVRAPVEAEPPAPPRWGRFSRNAERFNLAPANARELRKTLIEKWKKIAKLSADFVTVEGAGDVVIATTGVAYNYVKEVLADSV